LFLEELAWTVREHGDLQLPSEVPATLQAVLAARIDRLPPDAKQVLQTAAVIGTQVPWPVLQAIVELPEETLHRSLAHLHATEFLSESRPAPTGTYVFKHVLTQEAAYQSLLKHTRQHVHQRIAQVIETQWPETAQRQPEVLAQHYTAAGRAEEAVGYWQRAGERSNERSAYAEVVVHCTRGLDVLQTLPDTPTRAQQELDLLLLLGGALRITQGFAAPEVGHVFARAQELCRHVEATPQLCDILFGLQSFFHNRGACQTGKQLMEQALALAQRLQDPARCLRAHANLGSSLFALGELAPARTHLEQALTLAASQPDRVLPFPGQAPRVIALGYMARTLWYLGYPTQALTRSHEMLTYAQGLADPFSLVRSLAYGVRIYGLRREWATHQEWVEASMTLATEQGFAHWVSHGVFMRGLGLAAQSQDKAGIAQIQQGLVAYRATGAVPSPYVLAGLAEAYGRLGQVEAGLRCLTEAFAMMDQTGQRCDEAELFRLRGMLLQAIPDVPQAAACFQQALTVAGRQHAKSLELRAAMSLARLWQRQGQCATACELLAPIYGWFTEGFDTADLQEAKALLDELT
jgi:predicted ATPase